VIVALAAIVAAQLASHTALAVRWARERERLVEAVIARHAGEVAVMRRADTKAPREP